MAITVDTTQFNAALREVLLHTSRDVPTVINSAAVDIIIHAAKGTKKAEASDIEKALTTGTVVGTATKSGKKGKTYYKPVELVYLIINARQKKRGLPALNNAQMIKAAQKLIKQRKGAIGFTAYAGWNNALRAFGGHGFGHEQARFAKSSAAQGYGEKASTGRMIARMVNTAAAIEKYGAEPLRKAFEVKAHEFILHLEEKLAHRCRAVSK
jgi:hypothetical protein